MRDQEDQQAMCEAEGMEKTIVKKWESFDSYQTHLMPGDEVQFFSCPTKSSSDHGIFEKQLTKNYQIVVDGVTWRISPSYIKNWRRGNPDNIVQSQSNCSVKTSSTAFMRECKKGDVVLMYRGTFDVVEVMDNLLKSGKVSCRMLAGRGKGKIYKYDSGMYVQKLDKERLTS